MVKRNKIVLLFAPTLFLCFSLVVPTLLQGIWSFGRGPSEAAKDSVLKTGQKQTPEMNCTKAEREQAVFSPHEEWDRAVRLPPQILEILKKDASAKVKNGRENSAAEEVQESWFVASEIDLNSDGLKDLVVMADDARLWGANIVPFWIFRNTPRGYKLALFIRTLSLEVTDEVTKGFRDIRTSNATATQVQTIVFKFDGKSYVEHHSWWKPIE